MARKSIEEVMNEIEDFMNSCKTTALSSNKVVVPRDEFDELFGDLKVKIPAEIDRCKKIMRNKEAILMDARKTADDIIAKATAQANQMVSETAIVNQANQQAYETVELARVQANEMLAQAASESNELRLGSMQYTNDLMTGIRNYIEATLQAERANYENLISTLENDYMIASANVEEIQGQIVEFTGDPNSVTKAPQMKTAANGKAVPQAPKAKQSMVEKVISAIESKEDKAPKNEVIIDEIPIEKKSDVIVERPIEDKAAANKTDTNIGARIQAKADVKKEAPSVEDKPDNSAIFQEIDLENDNKAEGEKPKKVKKVVKKRNPVLHTPQTAQETVAKTVAAAANNKVDKSVYKANGEQAREVPPMEGNVKRGPRVGRNQDSPVSEAAAAIEENAETPVGRSVGAIDDYTMEKKI
ncbi:MAG: hypothetical protein IJ661_06715 [Lachnospiraceae bacterium]|nr:hypothetical protein [Lachnospiraceae bacterium]